MPRRAARLTEAQGMFWFEFFCGLLKYFHFTFHCVVTQHWATEGNIWGFAARPHILHSWLSSFDRNTSLDFATAQRIFFKLLDPFLGSPHIINVFDVSCFLLLLLLFALANPSTFAAFCYTTTKQSCERNFKKWKRWVAWVTLSDGLIELWDLIAWQWQEACSEGRRPHRKGSAHRCFEWDTFITMAICFCFSFLFEGTKWKQSTA